jgi:hypothetical protein
VQALRGLKDEYNFTGRLGETSSAIDASPVFYAVMTAADWNTHIDYKPIIKDVCDKFYGKAAGTMFKYNTLMDDAVMSSYEWRKKDWIPYNQAEFSMAVLEEGRQLLEQADAQIRGDATLEWRVGNARFAHANLTYARAQFEPNLTAEQYKQAQAAFTAANDLRRQYDIRVAWPTVGQLKSFEIVPSSTAAAAD